jgi:hypothetical protein
MSRERPPTDPTIDARQLLSLAIPATEHMPERIEACEVSSFDVQQHINGLKDRAALIEEEATAQANGESNADKRKLARNEYLRASIEYQELQTTIADAERIKTRLDARAARLAREHRARLLAQEITYLGRRS